MTLPEMRASGNISRLLTLAVGIICGIVAVVLPLGFFLISYQDMAGNLQTEAEESSEHISMIIMQNPETWIYQQIRFDGYLSKRPLRGYKEIRRILTSSGVVVAERADRIQPPLISRSAELFDAGKGVGRVEIRRSLRPVLVQTGLLFLIILPLAAGTFVVLRTVPIQALSRSEKSLRESEARFRRLYQEFRILLDAISDSLFLVSRDLKIVWANSGTARLVGKDAAMIAGQYCYAELHNRQEPCPDCYVLKSFATGLSQTGDIQADGGRLFDVETFPVRDESGEMHTVLVVLKDVTEKTTLRAEAMRAGHLASIGELAAGVAHEINNPINGIINYARMLADDTSSSARAQGISARIMKEGDRVAAIVSSLLSFGRERKDEKRPVTIGEILSEVLVLTGTQIERDGIHLETAVPEGLSPVRANPQQIEQVFLNVLSNARHALCQKYPESDENKKVSIQAESLVISGLPYVRICFLDYGTGIPADMIDRVTDPFFSTKPAGQGTGLGLSISYGIIKDHSGMLTIESSEGQFTRVIIDLPAKGA